MEVTISQKLEAVFEDGRFRPLEPPDIPLAEGQHVRLTVESEIASDDVLALAGRVYAGLSAEEVEEIERITLDRRPFFGDAGR